MPITVWVTVIENGQIVSQEQQVIDPDTNDDNVVSRAEWDTFASGSGSHNRGLDDSTNADDLFWDGTSNNINSGTINQTDGILYSYQQPTQEQIPSILLSLDPDFTEVVLCFARGAKIRTPGGEVSVEDLREGDLVVTLDNGPQPVRWIGATKVLARGDLTPIRIRANALGEGLPSADLLVSPHHRMVISGWRAEVLFGEPEVLAAARDLVNDDTIRPASDLDEVEYFHILFDRHEIVWGNGAMSESFHPADCALDKMAEATRDEILRLFPQLKSGATSYGDTARMVVGPRDARMILQ